MIDTNTSAGGLTFALPPSSIVFSVNPAIEIMRLDDRGMTYKGQRIEDGGEAHRAFLEVMARMKSS